jgi:hypothetical protein
MYNKETKILFIYRKIIPQREYKKEEFKNALLL